MKNLSLNTKMLAIIAIFTAAAGTIAYLGVSRMALLEHEINEIVNGINKRAMAIVAIRDDIRLMMLHEKSYILETNRQGMDAYEKQIIQAREDMRKVGAYYLSIASEEGKKHFSQIQEHFDKWWEVSKQVRKLAYSEDQKVGLRAVAHQRPGAAPHP